MRDIVVSRRTPARRLHTTRQTHHLPYNIPQLTHSSPKRVDRSYDDYSQHATKRAADPAYQKAGVGREEVNVAGVDDMRAFGEVLVNELAGLAQMGQDGPLALRGEATIGGRIPINPSGGLESKGHPLGATGLGQIFEIVTQLRGAYGARQVEEARIGLVENGGGYRRGEEAVAVVTLLGG